MTEKLRWRLGPEASFLILSSLLCTAVLVVLADPGYWAKPMVVAPAVMVDLSFGLPFLGYFFLIRTGRLDHVILVPLFLFGMLLARWWIPVSHQADSEPIKITIAVLEGAVLLVLSLRMRRIRGIYIVEKKRQPYASDALRIAVSDVLGKRLGGAVFSESAALWYAVTGWGPVRSRQAHGTAFSGFRRNAYPALLTALLFVLVIETGVVHLLVGLWSPRLAWVLSALGAYTILWLLGDFHAARLNQTLVSDFGLHLRTGLRWHTDVAWSEIQSIRTERPTEDAVKMTLFGKPDFWIEFRQPKRIVGILGIERRARFAGLGIDDPQGFRSMVESRISEDSAT